MNKILKITGIIILLYLTACQKDECTDCIKKPSDYIVYMHLQGRWKMVGYSRETKILEINKIFNDVNNNCSYGENRKYYFDNFIGDTLRSVYYDTGFGYTKYTYFNSNTNSFRDTIVDSNFVTHKENFDDVLKYETIEINGDNYIYTQIDTTLYYNDNSTTLYKHPSLSKYEGQYKLENNMLILKYWIDYVLVGKIISLTDNEMILEHTDYDKELQSQTYKKELQTYSDVNNPYSTTIGTETRKHYKLKTVKTYYRWVKF